MPSGRGYRKCRRAREVYAIILLHLYCQNPGRNGIERSYSIHRDRSTAAAAAARCESPRVYGRDGGSREVDNATKRVQNQRVPVGVPTYQDRPFIRSVASKWDAKSATG